MEMNCDLQLSKQPILLFVLQRACAYDNTCRSGMPGVQERWPMITRAECQSVVDGPGKFEGCAIYVPYFYEVWNDGGADEDEGKSATFYVTEEDREEFPELEGVFSVTLLEGDDGFIHYQEGR